MSWSGEYIGSFNRVRIYRSEKQYTLVGRKYIKTVATTFKLSGDLKDFSSEKNIRIAGHLGMTVEELYKTVQFCCAHRNLYS